MRQQPWHSLPKEQAEEYARWIALGRFQVEAIRAGRDVPDAYRRLVIALREAYRALRMPVSPRVKSHVVADVCRPDRELVQA